jgi:hypothetical protein
MRSVPEIVEVDSTRLEEVLRRVEQALDEKDSALVRAVFESHAYVADLVEDKNTSIRRLRQLFFGARTEKTEAVVGHNSEKPNSVPQPGAEADAEITADKPAPSEPIEPNAAAASKVGERKAKSDSRVRSAVLLIRGRPEWKQWAEELKEADRAPSLNELIDRALVAYARRIKFRKPAPRR